MSFPRRCFAVGALGLLAAAQSACGGEFTPKPHTFNIHTTGDIVTVAGGLITITVPPAGISEDGIVTATALPAGAAPTSPLLVSNSTYEVTVSPTSLRVLKPILVQFSYASRALPVGVRGPELRLNKVVSGAWQPIPGGTNDSATSTVAAAITSFSDFGVLGLPVASLVVNPPTISVAAGATQSITATPEDSLGNVLPNRAVTYTSSDIAKATVNAAGVVTGVAAGTATITVASESQSAQIPTTVTPGAVSTSQSTVSVSAGTVASGGTVTLTLRAKDAAGNNLTTGGLTVAFTVSGGTSTGTIGATTDNANGTYTATFTAVAAGTATTVRATIGGAAVTSTLPTITVTTVSAAECASPGAGWIWCDDFEQDRLASYFDYDNAGGDFVRVAGVGRTGSFGMRARWSTVGQSNAGALHLAFGKTPQAYFRPVDAGTQVYRDIYWRMYLRLQPGWTGGGANKLSRATVFASTTTWAQAMFAHVWSGSSPDQNYLILDPASGTDLAGNLQTTDYNDFPNMRWLGGVRGNTALFAPANAGTWYCVEARARLNDAGQSNGVFQLWIDGALEAERTGLNWLGAFSAYGINAVYFENYWNAGAPQAEERYFDNVVVSTQRIGC